MSTDEIYMQRCIELARMGAGNVAPNPMVGCVIVFQDKIIGEGWHWNFGGPHAEVNAIASVKNNDLLQQATVYVNLEPCSHFGKTSPCADLLIEIKIKKVVIGMVDPNPLVAGNGIKKLKEAGIDVVVGVLENTCKELNKRFITFIEKERPYIILKWAQTRNGYIAPDASKMSPEQFEKERHITGKVIQKLVHKWRTQEGAIMVGTQTALLDNPALNTREWIGAAPLRIVLDRTLRLPVSLKIYDHSQPTWIVNEKEERADGNLKFIRLDFKGAWFSQLLTRLFDNSIQSIIIEGGNKLLTYVIDQKLWDEAIVFYSPKQIIEGVKAPFIGGQIIQLISVDNIEMSQYIRL